MNKFSRSAFLSLAALAAALVAGCTTSPTESRGASAGGGKSPIADHTVIHLANGFKFTEGATSDKDGNVYFVDQPNNAILKWTFSDPKDPAKGALSTFLQPSNYS